MARPPRPVVWVALATAFSLLGDQTLYSVLPTNYATFGLIPFQVGLLLSVNRWVRLLTNHLAERLIQRYGLTRLLACSLAVGAGLTAGYARIPTFPVLLGLRLVWGLCWSFIRQSGMMTVADSASNRAIGQMTGYYNGIARLGSLTGNLLGAVGNDLFGFGSTLLLFSGASLLGVPMGVWSQRGLKRTSQSSESFRLVSGRDLGLWACGFIVGCVGPGLLMSTLGLVLRQEVGDSVTVRGVVLGVATLNGLALSTRWLIDGFGAPMLGAFSDWTGRRRAAFLFFGIGAFSLTVGAVVSQVFLLALCILVFFLSGTTLTTIVAAEAGNRGSRDIASYVTAADMGSALGPLLGWTTQQYALSTDAIFLIGAGFYAIGIFVTPMAFGVRHEEASDSSSL